MKDKSNENQKQISEFASQLAEKGKEFAEIAIKKGRQAKDFAADNLQLAADKLQDKKQRSLLKKYRPVFPGEYMSDSFSIPNMIVISTDTDRRDIEVCRGAIGWMETAKNTDILFLHENFVADSGLSFIPVANTDTVYYVDNFDRNRYIKLDSYFDIMQSSKLAELEHIAFSLGAKRYTIEEVNSTKGIAAARKKAAEKIGIHIGPGKKEQNVSAHIEKESVSMSNRMARKSAEFSGGSEPVYPNLRWFRHDDNINNLIDMRLSGRIKNNDMKRYSIDLEGSDYSSISSSAAAKIDTVVSKLNIGGNYDISEQCKNESSHKLVFDIEF